MSASANAAPCGVISNSPRPDFAKFSSAAASIIGKQVVYLHAEIFGDPGQIVSPPAAVEEFHQTRNRTPAGSGAAPGKSSAHFWKKDGGPACSAGCVSSL